ncbi:hypothetical protein CRUP_006922, partial [Coryphaenoides rupestris]
MTRRRECCSLDGTDTQLKFQTLPYSEASMAALRAAKQALRRDVKRRVAALSEQEKQRQSAVVSLKLFKHPKYASCERIAVFLSMHDEVCTEDILRDLPASSPGGLDLILMPGLGFDRSGKRLGRGKGFYDTYLERCARHPRGKPYTVALAFKEQLCAEIPVGDHDMLIDEILYEDLEKEEVS